MSRAGVRRHIKTLETVLRKASIEFIDENPRGAVPRRKCILVWPYNHKDVEDMADTLTHEAVHHADMERPEGAVRAITAALMRCEEWRAVVFRHLAIELFEMARSLEHQRRRSSRGRTH